MLVRRDVSVRGQEPGNICIQCNHPLLLDFGLDVVDGVDDGSLTCCQRQRTRRDGELLPTTAR